MRWVSLANYLFSLKSVLFAVPTCSSLLLILVDETKVLMHIATVGVFLVFPVIKICALLNSYASSFLHEAPTESIKEQIPSSTYACFTFLACGVSVCCACAVYGFQLWNAMVFGCLSLLLPWIIIYSVYPSGEYAFLSSLFSVMPSDPSWTTAPIFASVFTLFASVSGFYLFTTVDSTTKGLWAALMIVSLCTTISAPLLCDSRTESESNDIEYQRRTCAAIASPPHRKLKRILGFAVRVWPRAAVAGSVLGIWFGIVLLWTLLSITQIWRLTDNTKSTPLSYLPMNNTLGDTVIRVREDVLQLPENGFPFVFKPNMCTTSSRNVELIEDASQGIEYIKRRELRGREWETLVQRYFQGDEAAIFYYRYPFQTVGHIKAVGVKPSPDEHNAAFHSNSFHESTPAAMTPQLLELIDSFAQRIPGFYVGRFDVMYQSLESLKRAEGIFVIELNVGPLGDTAEKYMLKSTFIRPLLQARTMIMQIFIGLCNILSGNAPMVWDFALDYRKAIARANRCEYHEHFWGKYR